MSKVNVATPRISVRLYKSVMRKAGGPGLPASQRYANKEAFIDLTPFLGDGSSVITSKSITDAGGTFSISFSDKPNQQGQNMGPVLSSAQLESVAGLIEPMDVVEIRMWGGLGTCPNPLPIRMRGFVTRVNRRREMGQDGKPRRVVTVSGNDYTKALTMYQIVYNPYYDGGGALMTGWSFFEQVGEGAVNNVEGQQLIDMALNAPKGSINSLLAKLIPENNGMPRQITADVQAQGKASNAFANESGTMWDLLSHYLDVPLFNELFVQSREAGEFLVWRPRPFFDMTTRESIQPILMPDYAVLPDNMIVSIDQNRDDTEVYNWVWATSTAFDLAGDQYRQNQALLGADKTPAINYPNTSIDFYGIRAMYGDTVMDAPDVAYNGSGLTEQSQNERSGQVNDWISDRRRIMQETVKDNVVLETGSILAKGGVERYGKPGELLCAGDYVSVRDGLIAWDGYVTAIVDTFTPYVSYTQQLNFERGTGFAERVAYQGSPWLLEQATRQEAGINASARGREIDPQERKVYDWRGASLKG
ncbi:MAG: hypothetical protein RR903_00735 [Edwardsiella sp. (in: enterobacteria)]